MKVARMHPSSVTSSSSSSTSVSVLFKMCLNLPDNYQLQMKDTDLLIEQRMFFA